MKRWVKAALYHSGLLWLIGRLRNRSVLTVLMFHRVLASDDPRFAGAHPTYTITDHEFAVCLQLMQRYFTVVSLAQVEAVATGSALPPCPVLITFDDGWSDNLQYGLPLLRRERLPAVVFVATAAIGRHEGFWQEEIVDQVLRDARGSKAEALAQAQRTIEQLRTQPPAQRAEALSRNTPPGTLPRRMLTGNEIMELAAHGVAIGGHGHTHEPLTEVTDAAAELAACHASLEALGVVDGRPAFSFPHGRFSRALLDALHERGFGLCFTSEHRSLPVASLGTGSAIGRLEVNLQPFRRSIGLDCSSLAFFVVTGLRRAG
jgi:peptidoglycan/xylan/chitin deacetylase (PgdA/CDA1 family)